MSSQMNTNQCSIANISFDCTPHIHLASANNSDDYGTKSFYRENEVSWFIRTGTFKAFAANLIFIVCAYLNCHLSIKISFYVRYEIRETLSTQKMNPVLFFAIYQRKKSPRLYKIISLASQITEDGVKTPFKLKQKKTLFPCVDAAYNTYCNRWENKF